MADDQRTIKIVLETKQAEKNTDKLGDSMKKAKDEAKGFSGVLTKQAGGLKSMAAGLLKIAGPLAAMAAGFKLVQNAIRSNLELSRNLERQYAGLMGIIDQITADIGNYANEISKANDGQSWLTRSVDYLGSRFEWWGEVLFDAGEEVSDYTEKLKKAQIAAQELNDIQFEMNEQILLNNIEISEARQVLEEYRLASRNMNATDSERLESQKLAIEQIKILRKEKEDEWKILLKEQKLKEKAAAGSVFEYKVKQEGLRLDRLIIDQKTSLIQLENTLTERLGALQRAEVAFLDTQSKVVDEVEEFDMAIFDSNLVIQQRNEATVTMNEITSEATEKVKQHTDAVEEDTDAQDGYNVTLQSSYSILNRMVNLFKNFNFSSLMSLIFSGLQIAGNFVSGGATGFLGKFLGFKQGGIVQGPSHEQGGVRFNIGGVVNELEGGEGVINKQSMGIPWVKNLASQLNQIGGGVRFAQGGIATGPTAIEAQTARLETLLKQRQIVAITEDIQTGLNTVQIQDNISSI